MGSLVFWGGAVLMLVGVALVLLRALHTKGVTEPVTDVQVYKNHLAEIDRDVARGVATDVEAARMRVEVSRRILAADRERSLAVTRGHAGVLAGVIALVLGGAVWGYLQLGAFGYADLPLAGRIAMAEELRANRPGQAVAEAQAALPAPTVPDASYAGLMERLRQAVQDRPDDAQGLALLARNEAGLGNLAAARVAQTALIAAKGAAVTADDHADLAELLVASAGGYVSPEAEHVLEAALKLDAANPKARYYAGLMLAQVGRFDLSFRLWKPLVGLDATWSPVLLAQIEDVAIRAGVNFVLPEDAGPTTEDMAAAKDMTPEQRQVMIQGMVTQLSDRLATEGGPATDWARLITSLTVLGQTDQARAILSEARTTFATNAPDLAVIDAAATEAGL
jgi:cytochrome c-type biogenesis protein CcmH